MRLYVVYNLALMATSILCMKNHLSKIILPIVGVINLIVGNFIRYVRFTEEMILRGPFGVHLIFDNVSSDFLLMCSIVWFAVVLSSIRKNRTAIHYFLLALFLPVCNLAFLSNDLFNIYVTLEVVALLTFLLASTSLKTSQLWASMKYIVICTAGMNLYLLGVGMHFLKTNTFSISQPITGMPAGLMVAGLLAKAGVFFYSMWLIDLHSNAESEISALLSGVSIKTGVYALLRIQPHLERSYGLVVVFAIMSAVLGVIFALNETHYKRILAYHSLSQVGYMLVSPTHGSTYALAHGVFKGLLFLLSDEFDTYEIKKIFEKGLPISSWLLLTLASLTISGLPMTIGGVAKDKIFSQLTWEKPFMYIASIGTTVSFAKFILFPNIKIQFNRSKNLLAYLLLIFYCLAPIVGFSKKPLFSILLIAIGMAVHLLFRKLMKPLPRVIENMGILNVLYVVLVALCVAVSINV